jgi:hypothetical protein
MDIYKELDNMEEEQDLFLALAVYDWYFFNDTRIYRLKKDYNIKKTTNDTIFTYYYSKKPHVIKNCHDIYSKKYTNLLTAVLY